MPRNSAAFMYLSRATRSSMRRMILTVVSTPHVGGDEHLLQIVQHLGVDRRAARYGTRQFREKARLGAFQSGVQLLAPLFGLCFDSRPGGSIGRRILFLSEQIEKSHNKIGFSRTIGGLLHGCIAPRFRPAGIYSCDKDNNYSQN